MNRKLLYAGLALVILLPFGYGFAKGYSLWVPFANLIAFAVGKEYDALLLILVLLTLLLSVAIVIASTSSNTSSSAKKHVILHPSDGRQIAEENQRKVLHQQQLLKEVEHEKLLISKRPPADTGLDMCT